jgi:hypothetical protein
MTQDRAARVAAGGTVGSLERPADGIGPTLRVMRRGLAIAAAVIPLAGCGGSAGHATSAGAPAGTTTVTGPAASKIPPGAVGPVDTAEEAQEGPAATEASPGEPPRGPSESGSLSDADRTAVTAAVAAYVTALNRHDAARVCALLAPGSLPLRDLPAARGGCGSSLRASIGTRPRGGGPAWRRSALAEAKDERLGPDRARVSATIVHHFSDRKYVSVEDDVIYLARVRGRWLLAKPSATLYRAVGYAQPPLRAFAPPDSW